MKNLILITLIYLSSFTIAYSQDHVLSLGSHNLSNISINYERIISADFHLRLTVSRSLIDGNASEQKVTYDYTGLSAKIFNGEILNFEFYHGPSILFGYYYEYTNFTKNLTYYPNYEIEFDAIGTDNNNLPYYQNSSMISPEYHIGLEREIGSNILTSIELALGTHFLLNDYMSILDKFNMGNFIPYIGLRLYISYNYPNSILEF
tara:strand:- start:49 stop:663 length:615 start_codon:yes stop_codon:yes gene_type:complete